jgi:hypothetical protein
MYCAGLVLRVRRVLRGPRMRITRTGPSSNTYKFITKNRDLSLANEQHSSREGYPQRPDALSGMLRCQVVSCPASRGTGVLVAQRGDSDSMLSSLHSIMEATENLLATCSGVQGDASASHRICYSCERAPWGAAFRFPAQKRYDHDWSSRILSSGSVAYTKVSRPFPGTSATET